MIITTFPTLVLALSVSAASQTCSPVSTVHGGGWAAIASAPHDGTVVEMQANFGPNPFYALVKWDGTKWVDVKHPIMGFNEKDCLSWRLYVGAPKDYVNPNAKK